MWIPDPLYRLLPLVYLASAAVLLAVDGPAGATAVSAALLMCAGVVVMDRRARYRAAARRRRSAPPHRKLLPTL